MSKKSSKAQQAKVATTYNINDTVLGKVRGFPPWPGMVVDPDNVHPTVALERPSSKKATFYCVRFFPLGDHAWLVEKDISKLQRHEIESYISEPHKKSSELLNGYRIALDPATWLAEKEAMIQDTVDMEENAEIDQLAETEDGEDEGAAGKKQGKKRKRDDASASVKENKERKKSDKPAKAKAKKDADAGSTTRKAKAPNGNGASKRSKKSQAMVESEDEGEAEADVEDDAEDDADAGPSTKSSKKAAAAADKAAASPPPAKKAKRDRDDDADKAAFSLQKHSIGHIPIGEVTNAMSLLTTTTIDDWPPGPTATIPTNVHGRSAPPSTNGDDGPPRALTIGHEDPPPRSTGAHERLRAPTTTIDGRRRAPTNIHPAYHHDRQTATRARHHDQSLASACHDEQPWSSPPSTNGHGRMPHISSHSGKPS